MDGGFLSDDDKTTLTSVLFPHLVYETIQDRFVSKPSTYAMPQATAYLRRLVQDHRDKSELSRKTKISFNLLDAFASGQKDLSTNEKTALAALFGIRRLRRPLRHSRRAACNKPPVHHAARRPTSSVASAADADHEDGHTSSEPDNVVPLTPSQKARFKPGNQMAKRKRAHNKITRDLKEGIISAAIAVGEDGKGKGGLLGYLKMLARKHPKYYVQLLSRVLPLQVSGGGIAVIDQVNILPVPSKQWLSPEDVAAMLLPPDTALTE